MMTEESVNAVINFLSAPDFRTQGTLDIFYTALLVFNTIVYFAVETSIEWYDQYLLSILYI